MYSIEHNTILRENQPVAEITADGSIVFVSQEFEKYRLPVWNHLEKVGRITGDKGIYFQTEVQTEVQTAVQTAVQTDFEADCKKENALVINTVRELREVLEKMTGEAAPFLSKSLGDQTPEIWDYFKRHRDMIDTVKSAYIVNLNLERLEK